MRFKLFEPTVCRILNNEVLIFQVSAEVQQELLAFFASDVEILIEYRCGLELRIPLVLVRVINFFDTEVEVNSRFGLVSIIEMISKIKYDFHNGMIVIDELLLLGLWTHIRGSNCYDDEPDKAEYKDDPSSFENDRIDLIVEDSFDRR